MTKNKREDEIEPGTAELDDEALEAVNGGIGLLLPAVQKVREAAADGVVDAADYTMWQRNFASVPKK